MSCGTAGRSPRLELRAFASWARLMARRRSLKLAERVAVKRVSQLLMEEGLQEWCDMAKQSKDRRMLQTIRDTSADFQDVQARNDELRQTLEKERAESQALERELRHQLEHERGQHARQVAAVEASKREALQQRDALLVAACSVTA